MKFNIFKKNNIKEFLDTDEEIVYEGKNSNGFILLIIPIALLFGFPRNAIEDIKIFWSFEVLLILLLIWNAYRFIFHKIFITDKSLVINKKNTVKIDLKEISDVKLDISYGMGDATAELQVFSNDNQKFTYSDLSIESGKHMKSFLEAKIKGANDGSNN